MMKPRSVVELGTGIGGTAALIGLAARQNGVGHVWTVDNGEDWDIFSADCLRALDLTHAPNHAAFIKALIDHLGLRRYITHIDKTCAPGDYYSPPKAQDDLDLVFADLLDTGPEGCVGLLSYYLPRLSTCASIIIDRASTINHSFLLLEQIVSILNGGRLPMVLVERMNERDLVAARALVGKCRFTLIHLADDRTRKANRHQNSRAWIKIDPIDIRVAPHFESFRENGTIMYAKE
jgi:hypothetical protein